MATLYTVQVAWNIQDQNSVEAFLESTVEAYTTEKAAMASVKASQEEATELLADIEFKQEQDNDTTTWRDDSDSVIIVLRKHTHRRA